MTGMLKRKHDELEDDVSYISSSSSSSPFSSSSALSGWESDEEISQGGIKPTVALNMDFIPTSILKKSKRQKRNNVEFDRVTVFYFPRCQGFTTVPSCGGCTLGMARKHGFSREFTMSEFCKQQQIVRREKVKDRLKEEKLEALKLKLTMNGTKESEEAKQLTIEDISVDDVDISNVDLNNGFFLQPYTTKKRRALLKAMGVKIDREEKRQLQRIRLSRENCGCNCQGFCDAETCSCSLAGIKCQMDYTSFPCGCTRDGCGNTEGRIEFNQARVQTHFIHTLMRLELEENQKNGDRNLESELSFRDHLHPFVYPVNKASYEERAVTLMPVFNFTNTLETVSENSCSSNMTDSSVSSSNQSEDLEDLFETNAKSQSDIDDNGLARILHFNDSDAEEDISSVGHCQDNLSSFHPSGFFSVDVENQCATNPVEEIGFSSSSGYLTNISECLDENANQGPSGILEEISAGQDEEEGASYSPSSFEDMDSKNYMDLSFSSDSLDVFQSFSDYNLGPLYNSLKEYENVDNFTVLQLQLPNLPTLVQPADQNSCFLESLIGMSESIPEIPAPFSDNQLLEDAIKSSLVETMKV